MKQQPTICPYDLSHEPNTTPSASPRAHSVPALIPPTTRIGPQGPVSFRRGCYLAAGSPAASPFHEPERRSSTRRVDPVVLAGSETGAPAKSCQHALHHFAGDVREPEIASAVAVGEPLVVQPEQVQNRRVQVMHMDSVFGHTDAVVV